MSQANSKGASHTPGPWKTMPGTNGRKHEVWAMGDHGQATAFITNVRGEQGDENSEANAALIAGAPTLLALVQEWLESVLEAEFDDEAERAVLVQRIRAAIAKAEGR